MNPHTGPIRWAIAATGGIATRFAGDFARVADPDASLVAVGSRSHTRAADFAREFDIPTAHGSYGDLAADSNIDVVYVATLAPGHRPDAIRFLEAGKHVLVEKPMALSAAEVDMMVAAAEANDRFLMEAMWMRFSPFHRQVTRLIADGAIGELHRVQADFSIAGEFDADHRMVDLAKGGGALLDLGIYPMTLAWWLLGEPTSVDHVTHVAPSTVDDDMSILLGWPSGASATLTTGSRTQGSIGARLEGSSAALTIDSPFHAASSGTIHRSDSDVPVTGPTTSLHWQVDEVNRCLRAGHPESPDHPNSTPRAMMACFDAIRADIGLRYPTEP